NNIFREVSPEFVNAVGARSADILGRDFEQVAKRLKLDPDGEILSSLQRRDTWSGKSVFWPIENTDLRVPVDLAALPYYSRERTFEGYRGFGVVRLPDAVIDPDALGYSFDDRKMVGDDTMADNAPSDEATRDEPADDPFQGEVPVLRSAAMPREPRTIEKPNYAPHLAPSERAAFDEIGDHLRGLEAQKETDAITEPDDDVVDNALNDYMNSALDDGDQLEPADSDNAHAFSDDDKTADSIFDEAMLPPRKAPIRLVTADDEIDDVDSAAIDYDTEIATDTDDQQPQGGLTPDILDGLPLALLVVRNEQALFGNASFQIMTGYDDIELLNDRGGLDALVLGPSVDYLPDENDGTLKRPMTLLAADGDRFAARAHMQIIPWQGASAIMFAFEPVNEAPDQDTPYLDDDEFELPNDEGALETPALDNLVQLPLATANRAQSDVESALQQHINELESILDIASDAVVILKKDGTIRSINGPGEALFGYDKATLEGKSFAYLFAHESQRTSMDYLRGMTDTAISSVLNEGREVLGREQNGGFIPLFMTMGTLPATDAICAVLRDITPWKQTEQALKEAKQQAEQASTSKSEFLAKISHEIRTPLNAIIGFSDLIAEERFGALNNQRYKDYLTDINKSGRHVLELVNDLLDISKIESGNQELSFEAVDLNAAVDDAMVMVQPQAARERIIMRSSYDPKLPGVVADVRSVRQIVLNLLSNSVRFTHTGGLVVVSTAYNPDSGVVLRVKDTGIGMTAKEIQTALMPFQQVADRSAKTNEGTGLGLPLTKALVEANRAEFSIHSEPGRGTIVEILFPQSRVLVS
ncbi:MAG: ATP-binding protein, partial [Ahrensia sp.]